ncbi:cellulose binding domain-containing protein [Legionella jordanis]|uniref:cellulase n=1 Tax=Legionella jordanis TaxID=456 RepID=A0A0W0V8J3_9GAMM|nr:cellulose binding domain-containing protein [Legionella jordanis]KTD16410.1 endoglucanase [Legionella jordanis]RMX04388.1 hypothetical protein EAW55_02825 [Legionella jordanis]RMX15579.1 hypothetical protein EAS68_12020 [Legionella jordanis]VEH12129.1 endoglucanase [Legionella jordanis]
MIKKNLISSLSVLLFCTSSHAYYSKDSSIYDSNNSLVKIDGISWSGFQDSRIVQGLSSNPFYSAEGLPTSYSRSYGMLDALVHPWDYSDSGVDRSNSVSFKTLRLPIQPGVLYDEGNQVDMNRSLANKADPRKGNGVFCKTWETNGSACASTVNPKEAFWITLQELKANNVKVLIDFHHKYGYGDGYRDGTVYDLNQYEADVKLLAQEIKNRNLTNVIGIDVFNEPHQLYWFRDNGSQPAWIKVIASAAKILSTYNPDLLLFVEGSGQGSGDPDQPIICPKSSDIVRNDEAYSVSTDPANCVGDTQRVEFKGNWGEDFKPLLTKNSAKSGEALFDKANFNQKLKDAGLTDAAVTWLMGDTNGANAHIVFSPHVYPREVGTWESAPGKPSELRFDWTWGFLAKAGYPVVLGESSWKSSEGLAFFENAVVPYLQKHQMQNNLFFWAVGYLGDTISLIDPNSGALNLEAEKVLHDLYNQNVNVGKLNVSFSDPGFNLQGTANLKIQENGQSYSCSYQGCSINLETGSYHLTVDNSYQLNNDTHVSYLIKASNTPLAFSVQSGQATGLNILLEGEQAGVQPAAAVDYSLNLLDEQGKPVPNSGISSAIQFTSGLNGKESNCVVTQGHCTTTIYNQNLNSNTGEFANENYSIGLPSQLDVNGKSYYLVADTSDKTMSVGSSSSQLNLNAYYQASSIPKGSCSVKLTMQNRWDTGAVFQGNIQNTSAVPIKDFNFKISFNNSEVINPQIVNSWIGNNTKITQEAGVFSIAAQVWDLYNGLPPNQQQSIGFQISGQILKDISINVLGCDAK